MKAEKRTMYSLNKVYRCANCDIGLNDMSAMDTYECFGLDIPFLTELHLQCSECGFSIIESADSYFFMDVDSLEVN